jgi:hypothetical protein
LEIQHIPWITHSPYHFHLSLHSNSPRASVVLIKYSDDLSHLIKCAKLRAHPGSSENDKRAIRIAQALLDDAISFDPDAAAANGEIWRPYEKLHQLIVLTFLRLLQERTLIEAKDTRISTTGKSKLKMGGGL